MNSRRLELFQDLIIKVREWREEEAERTHENSMLAYAYTLMRDAHSISQASPKKKQKTASQLDQGVPRKKIQRYDE
jgi:hypothetical protein